MKPESWLMMSWNIVLSRGSTRCPNYITNVPLHLKGYYCSEFLRQVYRKKYMINIDECGFGQSVKANYSWLPKGRSSVIINDVYRGRANLILGISQDGDCLGLISSKTISSEDYCLYLLVLSKALKSWMINNQEEVILIQD